MNAPMTAHEPDNSFTRCLQSVTDSWNNYSEDEMHTPEALRARAALRTDPEVLGALDAWWATALRSMSSRTELIMDDYILISKKIYRALIEVWDEAEAELNAKEEWKDDVARSAHGATMDGESFRDAIFELADLWTPTISPKEYSAFLWELLDACAEADGKGLDEYRFWKPTNSIVRIPDASPYKSTPSKRTPYAFASPGLAGSLASPLRGPGARFRADFGSALEALRPPSVHVGSPLVNDKWSPKTFVHPRGAATPVESASECDQSSGSKVPSKSKLRRVRFAMLPQVAAPFLERQIPSVCMRGCQGCARCKVASLAFMASEQATQSKLPFLPTAAELAEKSATSWASWRVAAQAVRTALKDPSSPISEPFRTIPGLESVLTTPPAPQRKPSGTPQTVRKVSSKSSLQTPTTRKACPTTLTRREHTVLRRLSPNAVDVPAWCLRK